MRFALVVLVACSSTPRERAPAPPPPDASVAVSPDAIVDGPALDDAPETADTPAPPTPMPCRSVNGPNERFKKCIEGDKLVELARPIKLAIQSRSARGADASNLVVGGGTNVGIDKTWSAMVLDARDREMGEATITNLERDRIELLTQMPVERVQDFSRSVRFTPLPNTRLTIPPKPEPVVLKIKRRGALVGAEVTVIVAGGSRSGIDKSWSAVVLDAKQRALPGGSGRIERVDADETELLLRLTPDQIETYARAVRFTPP